MQELFAALALLISFVSLGVSLLAISASRPAAHPAPANREPCPEEARRERELTQGVENILSYSVRLGRGRSTGGDPL